MSHYFNVSIRIKELLNCITYFDDAEQNPMPQMFVDVPWEEVRRSILEAVEDYTNR